MRVLVAPDSFGGTLSAVEAAAAMAEGWRRHAPDDELDLAPVSDGGPGFVDVLHASIGGRLRQVSVSDPLRQPVAARWLLVGGTAYVESAQAAGLHLVAPNERAPGSTTTYGVGELLAAALDAAAERVVVGLGGSATNDGGSGLLAALGMKPRHLLAAGGDALAALESVDAAALRSVEVELVAATDVDNPLLGLHGATAVFGPQKGADRDDVPRLDAALDRWRSLLENALPTASGKAVAPGAGAAGGLGYALFALGAHRESGIELLIRETRLRERVAAADLVLTGEGSFDWQSLRGKAASGVAVAATEAGLPAVVVAGQVLVGRRELAAAGIEAAYAVADTAGSVAAAMARPAEELARLVERVAGTWSRRS